MSKVRLAIIGNGMVGHRFIEDLLDKSDAANFDITVFCEEPRIAYDRVHLSSYFSHHTAEELSLVREGFYEKHGIKVLVGERAITINRQEKVIHSSAGRTVFYDKLIMATGSYPWIPPIKGSDTQDCFVYRTIEDLNAIESCARRMFLKEPHINTDTYRRNRFPTWEFGSFFYVWGINLGLLFHASSQIQQHGFL